MPINEETFAADYGPWALITGGSDGVGAAFAHEIAARGINLMLVARRMPTLDAVAQQLRSRHGVEVRTLSLDLSEGDAARRLDDETRELDIGLIVFNAGADSSGALFLDAGFDEWRALLERNVIFLTESLYRFGHRLRNRGRGGLLTIGSEAAFGGGSRVALYTATKGYALNLCESLWAELREHDVHVQTLLFRIADTPTLREVLARKNIPLEATGAVAPERLAQETIRLLPDGPVFNFDETQGGDALVSAQRRRERALDVSAQMEGFYGQSAPD